MWYFDKPNSQDDFTQAYGTQHTSLYENLETNIPKFGMSFKGFPHSKDSSNFLSQQ
jgi:hypothetical protein